MDRRLTATGTLPPPGSAGRSVGAGFAHTLASGVTACLRSIRICCTLGWLLFPPTAVWGLESQLPTLGDSMSGVVSLEQERSMGQGFMRSLRGQVKTVADPVLEDYVEYLIYLLAEHSELTDRRLSPVILESRQLNAFAVPGGVVGINLGLFLYAETRSEFAAILAHELAHLSQRHFARASEANKQYSLVSLAGLLASVVLIATTGTDAGMAAMTTAQGLAQQAALRHSRSNEAEADRIGINTLVRAGMNPRAMAHMFERLSRLNRFSGDQMPEFLLTHPVTQSRIADSYNQAANYEEKSSPQDLDYLMMRNRVLVMDQQAPEAAVKQMQDGLAAAPPAARPAYQYGLVLALIRAGRLTAAQQQFDALRAELPEKTALVLAQVDILSGLDRLADARALLEKQLSLNPDNFPLSMQYAHVLNKLEDFRAARVVLQRQSTAKPEDPEVWYDLAETAGQEGDIPLLHQARAEFFVLNGNLEQALKQLEYALPLVRQDYATTARINQRLADIRKLQDESKRKP